MVMSGERLHEHPCSILFRASSSTDDTRR